MKKLHVGNEFIAIKDAMTQVQKNIDELTSKKQSVNLKSYASAKIIGFYEAKIASQLSTLAWLKKSL